MLLVEPVEKVKLAIWNLNDAELVALGLVQPDSAFHGAKRTRHTMLTGVQRAAPHTKVTIKNFQLECLHMKKARLDAGL